MQTFNINKEIQQIQNNIGIIISYFFIKQNQTLVPKIDPDYLNNQINNLSDKISKINFNYLNGDSVPHSSFSPKHIEFLNKSISQIHLHDLSETTTSKYIDEKRLKEIETMIQKQKVQIRELGGLLQKYVNTPIQPIQTNPNSHQTIIKNFIVPDNEVSKLNAQIKAIDNKMNLFKNDINQYVLDKRNAVNKSLKLFSGEYKRLLKMINSLNKTLSKRINSLSTRVMILNTQTNIRIDRVNSSLTATIGDKEAALNTRIDTVNSSLTATIGEKEAALNIELNQLSNHINTNFDVLYENSNQTSGRTVYFDKVKVNEIEFASVSNISDITSLSAALGNLTTNFNSIYQNTNIGSDKTAYFNKVVAENIECNNFTGVSDERLKKNIVDLKNVGKDLEKLKTVEFDWKSTGEADIGFIAQDVEKIFPTLVKTNKDGFKSVKYVNFVPILVQGYREQANELRKLKKILIIGLVVFFFFFMYKCI
jgi:hypothetical protein